MNTLAGLHEEHRVTDKVISKGGVGAVKQTYNPAFVFKEYFNPAKAPRLDDLRRLVTVGRDVLLRQRQPPGETPESSINWPVDVVVGRDGRPRGVILPVIPPALMKPSGIPRGLESLIMTRERPPVAKARVVLLLRMAEILAYLDTLALVHGDINAKNLAWAVQPAPVMYLIDCDGMVPREPPPLVGVNAVSWTDPRVYDKLIPAHDHRSDWYALALAMYRGLLLVPGQLHHKMPDGTWQKPGSAPDRLDPRVGRLLRRALDDPLNAHARPTPAEWVEALVAVYLPHGAYAEDALDALDQQAQQGQAARQHVNFRSVPNANWLAIAGAHSVHLPPPVAHPPPVASPGNPWRSGRQHQSSFAPAAAQNLSAAAGVEWFGAQALAGGAAFHLSSVLAVWFLNIFSLVLFIGAQNYIKSAGAGSTPAGQAALTWCRRYTRIAAAVSFVGFLVITLS